MTLIVPRLGAMTFKKAGIAGAGSWGTALGMLLLENRLPVTLWGHEPRHVDALLRDRENAAYLPGIPLPGTLDLSSELRAIADADLLLLVTPSMAIREVAARLSTAGVREHTVLLSCTKGVERGSGLRMSEIVAGFFPRNPIAVLSGPSHAEEVARGMPTAVVLGCGDTGLAERLQQAFSTPCFRAYTSDDVPGVEFGGALKNIFAIAAGVSDGLGLGDNSKAALVTRALRELIGLGTALGGKRETFQGLSGLGDLMVTCFSRHSRNRLVGQRLGAGERLADITASMRMIAEGVPTTYSATECARRLGIDTPIIDQMRDLLDGTISAREAMANLLGREPKAESPTAFPLFRV
ncbi:MAG: NAD(P)-dependent glycerol-3-phosphate dehydrogenase [Verrucomicrobiota bacterium]|nr:NAD(P)-dependent glycerol-3-phosphate dehydrogenase [Verrucomicrobiota bacterium]